MDRSTHQFELRKFESLTYVIVFVVGRSLIAEDEQKIIGEAADAVRNAIEFGKRSR